MDQTYLRELEALRARPDSPRRPRRRKANPPRTPNMKRLLDIVERRSQLKGWGR